MINQRSRPGRSRLAANEPAKRTTSHSDVRTARHNPQRGLAITRHTQTPLIRHLRMHDPG